MKVLPVSVAGLTGRVQDAYRRRRYPQKPIPNMHALIIGIDDYASINISKLSGAVSDAELMNRFLCKELSVPTNQIRFLQNQEATRAAIISGFTALQENPQINPLDPILIYYAGHGSEVDTPNAYVRKGNTPKTQCLVPHDVGMTDEAGAEICPIPDFTLSTLLYDLAEAKGNNITVIFDCCHSASSTRGVLNGSRTPSPSTSPTSSPFSSPPASPLDSPVESPLDSESLGGSRARYTNPSTLPRLNAQLDDKILTRSSPDMPQPSILREAIGSRRPFQRGMRSHVLLAACRHSEKAFERPSGRGGYFTAQLLARFRRYGVDKMTYKGCMEGFPKLNTPHQQNPVCEGEYVHRRLFNVSEPGAHYSFIPILFDGTRYILKAGAAQGITPNSQFGLYRSNILGSDNPQVGTCRVDTVRDEYWQSVCRLGDNERGWLDRLRLELEFPEPDTSLLQVPMAPGISAPMPRGTIDSILPGPPRVIAFAQLVEGRPTHTLDVYFTDAFRKAFRGDTSQFVDVKQARSKAQYKREVESEDEANTVLGLDARGARATFTLTDDEEESGYRPCTLPHKVPATPGEVKALLSSMLQWRWHSLRTPPDGTRPFAENLEVELYKLEKNDYDDSLVPIGESLNVNGEATITVSPKEFYGLKVVNNTPRPLFAYPFYFSMANQSIRPLFLRVYGGDGVDAPMEEYSDMSMGCGDDDHLPFSFQPTGAADISEGIVDIGIVRFFITTLPADFESVAQPSPFAALGWVKPGDDEFADGLCFAREEQARATLGGENVVTPTTPIIPSSDGLLARDNEMSWRPQVQKWDVVEMKVIIRRST